MNQYYLEFDQFVRSIEISKNDSFSLFLGAGASITSGIPSANDCIWEWKRNIFASKKGVDSSKLNVKADNTKIYIQSWLDSEGVYPSLGSDEEYSHYCEKCYPIEDDRRKFFQRICEKKSPSIGYKLIALLHELGMFGSVWTTNFDDLCRDSIISSQGTVIDIQLDSVDRILRPQNSKELLLIKLHGDYKYGALKNTISEISKQDEAFRSKLIQFLNDKHLIVAGYSGRDESIMDTLMESYAKPGGGRLYWCGYGRHIPAKVEMLLNTARSSGRTAYYIPTDGFDNLFISLSSKCLEGTALKDKYNECIKVSVNESQNTKTPFTLSIPYPTTVVRSNLFQIEFPAEVFQFEIEYKNDEKAWPTIREITKNKSIVAVPHEGAVWCFGTLTEINQVFGDRMKGKISRVSLLGKDISKDTSLKSLLLSTIVTILSENHKLRSDRRSFLWTSSVTNTRLIDNVLYSTHRGIRLSIETDGTNNYLTLMPDFHISTDTQNLRIGKEVYLAIGKSYFDKMRNSAFNEYIEEWRKLFFTSDGNIIEFEYPKGTSSNFIFKVNKNPGYSGIYSDANKNYPLSSNFPKNLLVHSGIRYAEPQLVFAPKHNGMTQAPKDFHPMRGVSSNKPFDSGNGEIVTSDSVRLAVICPHIDQSKVSNFLNGHQKRISSNRVNEDYLIEFPGFHSAFSTSLIIPEPNKENWHNCPEPIIGDIRSTAQDLRNKIIKGIDDLTNDSLRKVVIIYLPTRWLDFTKYDIDNEHYDLHDFIKAYCAERGIATQFIQEKTLSDALQCQINWWLSLSYFVKSMRTPWVLDSLDKSTAFAGIGYSVTKYGEKTDIILGCSHIYNSYGQGLKYRLSKVEDKLFWDGQKNPHLSYDDAYKLGLSTVSLFYDTMNNFPKRVVIHKRTYFTDDEINGLRDSLLRHGVEELDLIEISFVDDIRFVASKLEKDGKRTIDNYAVQRGTCILLNEFEALLWTHGVVESVQSTYRKFYLGGRYIPGPLRIKKHNGKGDIGQIATEILGLTKMNWNSFDLYSQLPATVNSSNEIARIGKLLSKREGVTYDYRHFI